MKYDLYPANWKAIALEIKRSADWKCEECRRPCKQPRESWEEFHERAIEGTRWKSEWEDYVSDESGLSTYIAKPRRFVLTVAHLDHNPKNCDRANLKALCSGCHLALDKELHRINATRTRAQKKTLKGQMELL